MLQSVNGQTTDSDEIVVFLFGDSSGRSAQKYINPGYQFPNAERLYDIIISALLQSADLIIFSVFSCEENDRT